MGINRKPVTMREIFFRYLVTLAITFIVVSALYLEFVFLLIKGATAKNSNFSE